MFQPQFPGTPAPGLALGLGNRQVPTHADLRLLPQLGLLCGHRVSGPAQGLGHLGQSLSHRDPSFQVLWGPGLGLGTALQTAVGVAYSVFLRNLFPTPFLTLSNSLGRGDPLLAEGENVRAVLYLTVSAPPKPGRKPGKMAHLARIRWGACM